MNIIAKVEPAWQLSESKFCQLSPALTLDRALSTCLIASLPLGSNPIFKRSDLKERMKESNCICYLIYSFFSGSLQRCCYQSYYKEKLGKISESAWERDQDIKGTDRVTS